MDLTEEEYKLLSTGAKAVYNSGWYCASSKSEATQICSEYSGAKYTELNHSYKVYHPEKYEVAHG